MKELWKPIVGYEGIYECSSLGNIRVLERRTLDKKGVIQVFKPKKLKLINQSNGYLKINLIKDGIQKTKLVHRLIAQSFLGDSDKTVNHINGIKTDNRIENLEWVTLSENHIKAFEIGLKDLKGEKSPVSKLTNEQVIEIRELIKKGYTQEKIASQFNVKRQLISKIKLGQRWSHV